MVDKRKKKKDRTNEEMRRRRVIRMIMLSSAFRPKAGKVLSQEANPYASYAFAADFDNPEYWVGGTQYTPLSSVPGYTFTRTGEQGAVDSTGAVKWFPANVPAINDRGYHAYGALTNYHLRSQEFDNASWTKEVATVTANAATAPDATTTADTLTTSGAAVAQYIFGSDGQTAARTVSFFLKAGTGRYVQIAHASVDTAYANFDLVSGVVGTVGAGVTAAYIVACANGWYRCIVVWTTGVAANTIVAPVVASSSGYVAAYTATVHTLHIWQASSLLGSFPDGGPIIRTAGVTAGIGESLLRLNAKADGTAMTDADMLIGVRFIVPPGPEIHPLVLDNGSTAEFIQMVVANNKQPQLYIRTGGAQVLQQNASVLTVGNDITMVARRLSGQWAFGTVKAGVLTWGATISGSTSAAFPAVTKVCPGNFYTAGYALNSRTPGAFIKPGASSSDADVLAAVAEATA